MFGECARLQQLGYGQMVVMLVKVPIQPPPLHIVGRIQVNEGLLRKELATPLQQGMGVFAVDRYVVRAFRDLFNARGQDNLVQPRIQLVIARLVHPADDAAFEDARSVGAVHEKRSEALLDHRASNLSPEHGAPMKPLIHGDWGVMQKLHKLFCMFGYRPTSPRF